MDDNKVAVLLEDLRAQFRTFGEGMQLLNEKVENGFIENSREHQQLAQMINELDKEVK
jgi:hypothetical protein